MLAILAIDSDEFQPHALPGLRVAYFSTGANLSLIGKEVERLDKPREPRETTGQSLSKLVG